VLTAIAYIISDLNINLYAIVWRISSSIYPTWIKQQNFLLVIFCPNVEF